MCFSTSPRDECRQILALANLPNERPFRKRSSINEAISSQKTVTETDNKYLDRHARVRIVLHFGWAFLTHNVAGPRPIIAALAPQRSLSIPSIGQVYAFSVSNCRSPKSLVSPSPRLMIGRSRRSRGFSVSPFFSSTFGCDFRRLGSNALDHAILCLPPLFVLAAVFVISAFGVWWHQLWLLYLGYG